MRTLFLLLLVLMTYPVSFAFSGAQIFSGQFTETDNSGLVLVAPFDLRDRESYFQITNIDTGNQNIHIQIYDVGNLCNENNFFDLYTPNDTHIYNLKDIVTNDGNPSGVDLPDNAYGIIVVAVDISQDFSEGPLIGNIRILDTLGYEYRTNAITNPQIFQDPGNSRIIHNESLRTNNENPVYFNFNSEQGVTLSDVFGIPLSFSEQGGEEGLFEATIDNVLGTWTALDVDIIDNNEVIFSCRDIIFACVDENNPLIEEILVLASESDGGGGPLRSSASVARFEYGINEVIPNSKDGELLCPGNNIPEGIVVMNIEGVAEGTNGFITYVGLNNGNGRGSFDSFFYNNIIIIEAS